MRETYGKSLAGMRVSDLAGKLIVIEGTDGAGRTTQINRLKPWLEDLGHAVLDTGMTRSVLAGDGIRIDLPVALMERAATTGFSAANHLLKSWRLAGHELCTVPTRGRSALLRSLAERHGRRPG